MNGKAHYQRRVLSKRRGGISAPGEHQAAPCRQLGESSRHDYVLG